jgi:cation diffusion facilitator CzcD-associated flavoprotein CzcO
LTLKIYEKNPDVGGTWYENRYPGCACDNPSHTYVWSFDPHPTWSSTYASSKEIFDYFKGFHFRFNLSEKTKVGHQIIGAKWDESTAKWNIDIKDSATNTVIHDLCDVLVNAGGILNAWRWPTIPGLHDFKGKLVHSAAWNESLDLANKHVGLIGNG